jgi:anti-sigma regulatory factor (Ser/Thr protein kinase)
MTPTRSTNLRNGFGHARRHAEARPGAKARERTSRLRLYLSATAEEVPFARAAITRLCEHLEFGDELTERIRLAVTEACTNCVLHAYDTSAHAATYVLDARLDQHVMRVVVCDRGAGVNHGQQSERDSPGLGLGLIEELADSSDVSARPGGGTRVAMRFALNA